MDREDLVKEEMDSERFSEKPTMVGFIRAFGGQLLTKMSGPLTVPFSVAACFVPHTWAKVFLGTLAILCAWVSSYTVWTVELKAVNSLENPNT
jgi:hypothetical protein